MSKEEQSLYIPFVDKTVQIQSRFYQTSPSFQVNFRETETEVNCNKVSIKSKTLYFPQAKCILQRQDD